MKFHHTGTEKALGLSPTFVSSETITKLLNLFESRFSLMKSGANPTSMTELLWSTGCLG